MICARAAPVAIDQHGQLSPLTLTQRQTPWQNICPRQSELCFALIFNLRWIFDHSASKVRLSIIMNVMVGAQNPSRGSSEARLFFSLCNQLPLGV